MTHFGDLELANSDEVKNGRSHFGQGRLLKRAVPPGVVPPTCRVAGAPCAFERTIRQGSFVCEPGSKLPLAGQLSLEV
jgi:hypothetical protein